MSTLKVDAIRHNSATSDAITTAADGTCTAKLTSVGGGQLSHRNIFINGAMLVAQRGVTSTSQDYQTVDRMKSVQTSINEVATQSQSDVASGTTPYTLGFRKAYKFQNGNQTSGANSDDVIRMQSRLEAQTIANSGWNYKSSSSYITLSFWCKSSVAQNFYIQLVSYDGSVQSYTFETGSLTADTWTKVTHSIPGNSNLQFDTDTTTNSADGGLEFQLAPFYGTNKTGSLSLNAWGAFSSSTRFPDFTSTWYTTNDATFEITGVQLEVGSQATPFEHISYGDELLKCQRYYQVAVSESHPGVLAGRGTGSSSVQCSVPLACSLRAVPSLSSSDFTQVYAYLYDSRPHNGSLGTVSTTSSQFNPTGAYLTIVVGGFGGQIDDDRIVNIGGYATDRKLILDSEI